MRRNLVIALLAVALMFFVACSSKPAGPAPARTEKVVMQGFKFQPPNVTISVGDKVEFSNADMVPHNAVSSGNFDSGKLQPGESWTFVAKQKGDFAYICTLHPNMKGHISVQ